MSKRRRSNVKSYKILRNVLDVLLDLGLVELGDVQLLSLRMTLGTLDIKRF